MKFRGTRFAVDREEGKLLGVCAGIARSTGLDATLVRVGVIVLALITSVIGVCVLYGVAAMVGKERRDAMPRLAASDDLRERMRAHELRMQAIETYTASANSRLAREIEELR